MKASIHPQNYRPVVFRDLNSNTSFLIKSTAQTKETVKYEDGQTYPLVKLHVTSASHPFYTGLEKVIDIEGRIDKFKVRRQAAKVAQEKLQAKSLRTPPKTPSSKTPQSKPKGANISKGTKKSPTPQTKTTDADNHKATPQQD